MSPRGGGGKNCQASPDSPTGGSRLWEGGACGSPQAPRKGTVASVLFRGVRNHLVPWHCRLRLLYRTVYLQVVEGPGAGPRAWNQLCRGAARKSGQRSVHHCPCSTARSVFSERVVTLNYWKIKDFHFLHTLLSPKDVFWQPYCNYAWYWCWSLCGMITYGSPGLYSREFSIAGNQTTPWVQNPVLTLCDLCKFFIFASVVSS